MDRGEVDVESPSQPGDPIVVAPLGPVLMTNREAVRDMKQLTLVLRQHCLSNVRSQSLEQIREVSNCGLPIENARTTSPKADYGGLHLGRDLRLGSLRHTRRPVSYTHLT